MTAGGVLDAYGAELAYLATRARLRREVPAVAAPGTPAGRDRSLLDTLRDEGSAALLAATAQLVS